MNLRLPALLGIWIAALLCSGCATPAVGPAKDTFAVGRGKSADAEVLAAGGLFGSVGQAGHRRRPE